jgi:hypothetical protein
VEPVLRGTPCINAYVLCSCVFETQNRKLMRSRSVRLCCYLSRRMILKHFEVDRHWTSTVSFSRQRQHPGVGVGGGQVTSLQYLRTCVHVVGKTNKPAAATSVSCNLVPVCVALWALLLWTHVSQSELWVTSLVCPVSHCHLLLGQRPATHVRRHLVCLKFIPFRIPDQTSVCIRLSSAYACYMPCP